MSEQRVCERCLRLVAEARGFDLGDRIEVVAGWLCMDPDHDPGAGPQVPGVRTEESPSYRQAMNFAGRGWLLR